jgi:hypothetical protein
VLHALIVLAADEAGHPSKTAFYVVGLGLAAFAVVVSAIGIARGETFPASPSAARVIMVLATVLVAGAMASAVLTS